MAHDDDHRASTRWADIARLQEVLDRLHEPLSVHAPDGSIAYANAAFRRLVGVDVDPGTDPFTLVHPDDLERVRDDFDAVIAGDNESHETVFRIRRPDGKTVAVAAIATGYLDEPEISGVVLTTRDISDRVATEDALRHLAITDPLTGLRNRLGIVELIGAMPAGDGLGVVLVDLHGFRAVNATFGERRADELLRRVADALRAVPGLHGVARTGSDEFVIVVSVPTMHAVADLAWQLWRAASEADVEISIDAHVGVAHAAAGSERSSLLPEAHAALDAGRAAGASVTIFDERLRATQAARVHVEDALRHAVSEGGLGLAFQPIVCIEHGVPVAWEALLRSDGVTDISELVTVAEETGLIVPIGAWVLRAAVQEAARTGAVVAVNVSARQLVSGNLPARVAQELDRMSVDGSQLIIEVTETSAIRDLVVAREVLAALQALGCRVAIDDFGTGHSSLAYLRELPVDILKIDRSFVTAACTDHRSMALLQAIVSLSAALGLTVVAEGLETEEEAAAVLDAGCRFGQGYAFGRAGPSTSSPPSSPCGHRFEAPRRVTPGLVIDRLRRTATVDGRVAVLTRREFDLLVRLLDEPGIVVSREQLLRDVWRAEPAWLNAATVTEHVRRLRVKLRHHGDRIETVRGVGYRMRA